MAYDIPFLILEADQRIGGRIKTDDVSGFLMNHGFQVLQTAYPEGRRQLDYDRLDLKFFAPGAMVRKGGRFFRVSDPSRRPQDFWSSLRAPIGSFQDRLRIIRLAARVRMKRVSGIFQSPDLKTIDFLRSEGFSETIIQSLFKPFFAGVSLDPEIEASSRVFQYIYRVFAEGDVALPSRGMAAIPAQLAEKIPVDRIRTEIRVDSIHEGGVVLTSGETISGRAVVLATEGPETARLLKTPTSIGSRGELCLYFAAKEPPTTEPFLILNGEGGGWVNSVTVPSIVAPSYAPDGYALISVVVIRQLSADDKTVVNAVRSDLAEWFGAMVKDWRHLRTYRIVHALPYQTAPMPDPTLPKPPAMPGIHVCGEYESVPGIQWAMLSGRYAAEQVLKELGLVK
jgi:phytoene dehydrogenase-like protein